jgi:carbon-monoxide dehydrogenase medium subunit
MRDFIYHAPTSLDEALSLLEQYGEDARPIAGGTAMVNLLKQNLVYADHLVGLGKVPGMRGITRDNGDLRIGALTRHSEVERSAEVASAAPLLQEAYSRVATVRIRNMATVGGGLTHADPAQDPPPALMALGARVTLASSGGTREVPVEDLFVDYYETALEPGELLTEVIVPAQPPDARAVYLKFLPRTEDDYATVAVAALARVENGACASVRVALGAVAPTPVRATAVETALEGQPVTADAIRSAAEAVAEQVDPLADFRGSSDYKRDMAVVFTRRALEQALGLGQ